MQPNRKRRSACLALLVAAVVLLAACGDDGGTDTGAGSGTTAGDRTTTTPTEAPAAAAAAPVSTTSNPTLGQILVDAKGLTVYVFDQDTDGKITCVSACANAWPPVVLEASASLPATGPLAADLSKVARPDGAQQVAYKGRPLYLFAGDAKAGDIKGDGVGNVWHAVKVGETASGGTAPASTVPRVSPY